MSLFEMEPVPSNSVRDLVAFYADLLKERKGLPLPKKTATSIARFCGELREDGLTQDQIKAGIEILVEKGLGPSALAGCCIEAAHTKTRSSGGEVCPICHLKFKTKPRLQEHLADVHHVDAPTVVAPSAPRS